MTPTPTPNKSVCIGLMPFQQWLRSADPYAVASMFQPELLTSVDGVMHLRLMGSPELARRLTGSDPLPESDLEGVMDLRPV